MQRLQARQLFISLHGKQRTPCRLKDHKLGFMLRLEALLAFRLLVGVIYGLEALVVGDVLDKRLDFPQSRFNTFQFLAGAVIGAVNVLDLPFKIGVLEQVVFCEIIECPRRFLEDRELGFILIALAVDKSDPLLNISNERDALRPGLSLASSGRPSGNPLLDAFLGVVLSDGLRTGKPILTFRAEGDVFTGLDFITGFLHEPKEVIIVFGGDDKPVNGLLELLLPTRAAFGFGVLLVAHAFVLRGRDIRRNGFLYLDNGKEIQFRGPGDIERDIKQIAPEELAAGMFEILKQNVTADKSGLYRSLAAQCGVTRVGKAINEAMDAALNVLSDRIIIDGEQISIK